MYCSNSAVRPGKWQQQWCGVTHTHTHAHGAISMLSSDIPEAAALRQQARSNSAAATDQQQQHRSDRPAATAPQQQQRSNGAAATAAQQWYRSDRSAATVPSATVPQRQYHSNGTTATGQRQQHRSDRQAVHHLSLGLAGDHGEQAEPRHGMPWPAQRLKSKRFTATPRLVAGCKVRRVQDGPAP